MKKKLKVVVTGGAGFIGSNLVRTLAAEGYDVHVVDTFVEGRKEERLTPLAKIHVVDIRDLPAMKKICKGAEYIFHLAALPRVQYSIDFPVESHDVNVNGTIAMLEAARAAKVKKVVFSSSSAVYGDQPVMPLVEDMPALPKSPYGLHKYLGEEYMRLWSELYGVPTVSLRYFNVYGPGFDPKGAYALVVGRFIHSHRNGQPLPIAGNGTNTRDYVHMDDVVRANILAAEHADLKKGEVINIGSGIESSVNQIAEYVGGTIARLPARVEPIRCVANIQKAQELLDWSPSIPIEDGISTLKKSAEIEAAEKEDATVTEEEFVSVR